MSSPGPQRITLAGQTIPYRLTRGGRRLSLTVDAQGLRVAVPAGLTWPTVEAFIAEHADWVRTQMQRTTEQLARRRLPLHDGARFPLLDGEGVIVLETAERNRPRARWQDERLIVDAATFGAEPLTLLVRHALIARARHHFGERLRHYCALLGEPPAPLSLGAARSRWGSCSARGTIRLNWRLIHLPAALGDYVVAHEVAHLRELNHGPRFWALVEALYPDWPAARRALRLKGGEVPLI